MSLSQAGQLTEADAVLGDAAEAAISVGNRRLEHHALIERLARRIWRGSNDSVDEEQQAIARAIPVFEAEADELGLARAHKWQAEIYNYLFDAEKRAQALEEALAHAQAAGDQGEQNEILSYLAGALVHSSTPADKAIGRCEELLERATTGPVARVSVLGSLAHLHARRGYFEQARGLISLAKGTAEEFGLRWSEARLAEPAGWISLLEGDSAAAEREFRRGCELFDSMGERGRRGTMTFWLAEAVYRQGRLDESERLARLAEELGQEEFPAVRAKVLASRGELSEAETLAHRTAELARQYRALFTYGLLDAGEVFQLAGLEHEALSSIDEALALYERSGNLVMAERARTRLASLRGPSTAPTERA
jgi:tetratricopeptide (TPR) repeat protein